MVMKDPYKILGVAPTDSKEKIQEVYRNLSRGYRGGIKAELKSTTEDKMKQLINAFNTLNDDNKRKDYDAQPHLQVRKTCPKLIAATGKKSSKEEKKPFKWGIPIMDIIMMPFKGEQAEKKEETPEEKAQMHFTVGISMSEDKTLYEQAKKEFNLSLKFMPDIKESYYNLGLICYRMGQFDEAYKHFKKVHEIDSKDPHAKKMIEILE